MCLLGQHWSSTSCANEISGHSRPYCDSKTDKCTNIRPDGCPRISTVSCLRDDVFPDISDCTRYYKCINSTAELLPCPENFIYKHEFGKCVFKLFNNECMAISSCEFEDFLQEYPGDLSLYYGCKAGKPFINACASSEFFNTTSEKCETRCQEIGLLAIPQNCMRYYRCKKEEHGFIAVEEKCPNDYGFNPTTLSCDKGYSILCNELAVFETNIYDFLSTIPILGLFTSVIRKTLNFVKLNPVKIMFIFRLSDDSISTLIRVVDYIYYNKRLPPTTIWILIKLIVKNLPSQLQFIFNILSQLGSIGTYARSSKYITV